MWNWLVWVTFTAESFQFSRSVVCDSLRTHGLQLARLPCPSPTPRACWNSCASSQWCHPTICHPLLLPSVFPSIRVFFNELVLHNREPKYWSLASVLPMNIEDWFPLGLTGLISSLSRGVSRVFFNTTVQKLAQKSRSRKAFGFGFCFLLPELSTRVIPPLHHVHGTAVGISPSGFLSWWGQMPRAHQHYPGSFPNDWGLGLASRVSHLPDLGWCPQHWCI